MSSPALQVEEASKRFGDTLALASASLTLERGEWLALLGPNGAGKTTLVRSIANRVRLDGGSIDLLGQRLDDTAAAAAVRNRLGLVPQEIALFPLLTAAENLRLWGEPDASLAASLLDLAPQVLVLSGACGAFLVIARHLARRWERV